MDYLKAYAHQVVSYHPEKGRDELFAELYDELREEFSDWQAEHTEGDEAAFLDADARDGFLRQSDVRIAAEWP